MSLPDQLLKSLEKVPGFDRKQFEAVHKNGEQVTSIRYNPLKISPDRQPVDNGNSRVPWSTQGRYLAERPFFTFDPLLHAGAYYVQEASSMFLEQALRQTVDLGRQLRVLDLCGAPGGKSTLIQSLISEDSLLISNDVIRSRANVLEENLTKWGSDNVIVSNSDPAAFTAMENYFDVIVVDAPCSGSGLFRRDPDAIDEWSPQNVHLCSQRQQRILADIYPALKQDGILIYSTCSYSYEEDEEITDWLLSEFDFQNMPLLLDSDWGIVPSYSPVHQAQGYRFYPNRVKGEGFYLSCFRKNSGGAQKLKSPKKTAIQKLGKDELAIVLPWLEDNLVVSLWKTGEQIIAFPAALSDDLMIAAHHLYIRKAGVGVGKIAGKELVPDHSLALSKIVSSKIVGISLNLPDALQYLRREEVKMDTSIRGWRLILYEGLRLGWVKALGNRVNNYYPKEWRILKSEIK